MSVRSAITGQDLPPSTLLLDAKGNEEQINLTRLRLAALQGNADITGVADWSKAISWNGIDSLIRQNSTLNGLLKWMAKLPHAEVYTVAAGSWIPEIILTVMLKIIF